MGDARLRVNSRIQEWIMSELTREEPESVVDDRRIGRWRKYSPGLTKEQYGAIGRYIRLCEAARRRLRG